MDADVARRSTQRQTERAARLMDPITRPTGNGGPVFVGPRDDPDRYRIGATVGLGGEGEVVHAVLTVGGIPVDVAIKMWRDRGEAGVTLEERLASWQSQLHLVQSISHPGIVRMREAFVGAAPHLAGGAQPLAEVLYLVMNWAPGVNLLQWAADHPDAGYQDVCRIVEAVAAALAHLHSGVDTGGRPILHRDLKPANVIVSAADRVQIVDFGLAGGLGGAPDASGTPAYLAPEVARSGRFSPASDVFGLGALTYFLLVGTSPPPRPPDQNDQTDQAGLRRSLLGAPRLAGRPDVADHVLAAMAPRAEDRPTDLGAWAAGLWRPAADITSVAAPHPHHDEPTVIRPGSPAAQPPPDPVEPPPRRRRPALAAGAAAVVTVAAVAALAALRMSPGEPQAVATTGPPATTVPPTSAAPTTTTAPAPTTTTPPTTRAPTTTTVAPTTTTLPSPPATTFVMPSRNIGCAVSAAAARCDIRTKEWTAPRPGTPCSMTWGDSLQVGPGGAGFTCHGDSLLGAGQVLDYGRSAQAGQYRCVSAETGVTCRHEGTGHGFTLAREAYDLF